MNLNQYQTPNLDTSWEQLRQTIQEQAELIRSLQAKACQCHIIDPAKIRVLLWINRHKDGKPETATLKIGEQRLLGLPRSDRRGESYWRFDEIIEKPQVTPPTSFKCSQCQEEITVIESDNYQEEIRRREALKKELVQEVPKEVKETKIPCWECKVEMKIIGELDETKPLVCSDCEKKKVQKASSKVETQSEPKSKRQELKEQIAQAIKENQKAQKENHAPANS